MVKEPASCPQLPPVIADVVHIAKSPNTSQSLTWEDSNADTVEDISMYENAFYYRLCGFVSKEKIASLFGEVSYLSRASQPDDETAF